MKQLLVVNSAKAINAGTSVTGKNLTGLDSGAIAFIKLSDYSTYAGSAAIAEDFAIALGQPNNSPAFLIPEVNLKSLSVVKSAPVAATALSATVTIPTTAAGSTYTVVLVKPGTVPHERNTWTATETVFDTTTQTATSVASKIAAYFDRMIKSGSLNLSSVTASSGTITFTGIAGDAWVLKAGDDLASSALTITTAGSPATGDKKYMETLASACAAGKGFTDTYRDGDTIYPGYPEGIENTTYAIYTLRFAVPRKSAKTRDEVVNQLVHIAVPVSNSTLTGKIDTLFGLS